MKKIASDSVGVLDIEQIELKGFSRSIAEIEWLLLVLVILYYVSPEAGVANPFGLVLAMVGFALFVLGFHYLNHDAAQHYWKLALETWVMIAFITWAVWNTGGTGSPLMNLYFLVIIAGAIALGKVMTFIEIAVIGAFYFLLAVGSGSLNGLMELNSLLFYFIPFLLVAYIAIMLAADVSYGRRMFKALSETDEMTGLLNKRSFSPMFRKACEVAEKYTQPLSVMMIDADNLKDINDAHGHGAGDRLIMVMADTISDCLRTSDVICRYGGDEYVALLPQLPADRAVETAERLRSAIANTSFDIAGTPISTTVSIGVASYPEEVGEVGDLLEKADEALYESKRAGRNRVLSWHGTARAVRGEPGQNDAGRRLGERSLAGQAVG